MVIDTRANVLIDQETWAKLPSGVNLEHTNTMPYNGPPLKICGQFKAEISCGGKSTTDTIYVTEGRAGNLLSCQSASTLGLIGLVYWGLTPQQQPGSYQGGEMMMKSVFWWRKPEYPEETTDLRQVRNHQCQ